MSGNPESKKDESSDSPKDSKQETASDTGTGLGITANGQSTTIKAFFCRCSNGNLFLQGSWYLLLNKQLI
jgi:hypothetical protein